MPELDDSWQEQDDTAADEAAPRVSARGAVLVGARILTGAIGIAVAAAVVAAAGWLPLPTVASEPSSTTVIPVPTDQQRLCAGPILRLGSDTGEGATTVSSIGTPRVVSAASDGRVTSTPLQSTDSTTGVAPERLTLPPSASASSAAPLLGASQTQAVDHGDISGFAAAECREANGDAWLVGGATTTGRTTLLTMSNPGEVIATVDVTIYTESGEVTAAGTDGIVVPPGGQRILSLAGFAPGATSPVVRVQSRGSQVVANLQQAVVRTLEPGGVDVIGAAATPAKTVVIPGIVIASPDLVAENDNVPGYADLATALRFLVPGTTPAKTQITVTPESGTAKPTTVQVALGAGKVSETPLGAFPAGAYTVTVRSDVPIVAAARSSIFSGATADGAAAAVDFAWFASAPELQKKALVAVGNGPAPELHLANLTGKAATVSVKQAGESGAVAQSLSIPAHGAVVVTANKLSDYAISGFDQLAISVSYSGAGALASYTVSPTGPASQPIVVYRH